MFMGALFASIQQNAMLRYSRLGICATDERLPQMSHAAVRAARGQVVKLFHTLAWRADGRRLSGKDSVYPAAPSLLPYILWHLATQHPTERLSIARPYLAFPLLSHS